MMKFLSPRVARVAAGLAVASAFAAAPMVAQADTTTATGTMGAGALSEGAQAIAPLTVALNGVNQSVNTTVSGWRLTDAVGDGAAYNVSVTAGAPTIDGTSIAGSRGSTWLALTPAMAADTGGVHSPAVTIPGNAQAGAYSDTLTYTIAAGVGA